MTLSPDGPVGDAGPDSPPQFILRKRLEREAEIRALREAELRELDQLRAERDKAKSMLLLTRGGIGSAHAEAREGLAQSEAAREKAEKEAAEATLVITELRIWREQHEKQQVASDERVKQAAAELATAVQQLHRLRGRVEGALRKDRERIVKQLLHQALSDGKSTVHARWAIKVIEALPLAQLAPEPEPEPAPDPVRSQPSTNHHATRVDRHAFADQLLVNPGACLDAYLRAGVSRAGYLC